MRSYSDYRKRCIRESLNHLSARGSSFALFDILKLDLLESTKLPELLTENVVARSDFNRFSKDYQQHSKHAVERICEYGKLTFYDELMLEVDVNPAIKHSIDPAAAFRMMRDELKFKISQMCKELKDAVASSMSVAGRDVEDPTDDSIGDDGSVDPTASVGSAGGSVGGKMGGGPTASGGPGPAAGASHAPAPTSGHTAAPAGAAGSAAPAGGPTVGGAFGDMMTALRPKDGWLKGAGRVLGRPFRDLGRYIKKNWYDENMVLVGTLLQEQNTQVTDLIDKFEKDLLSWFDQRSAEIAKDAGIDISGIAPTAGAAPQQAAATTPGVNGGDFIPMGTKADNQNQGIDPGVVTGTSPELAQRAAQGDQVAKKKVNQHHQNLLAACDDLGMKTGLGSRFASKGKKLETPEVRLADLEIDGVPASQYQYQVYNHHKPVMKDGQPVKKPIGNSKVDLIREIVKRIYVKLGGRADDPALNTSRGLNAGIMNHVWNQLKGGGGDWQSLSSNQLIAALLLRYGAMKTGSLGGPLPEAEPEAQAVAADTANPAAGTPATPAAAEPTDSMPMGASFGQAAREAPPAQTESPDAKLNHVIEMTMRRIKDMAAANPNAGSAKLLTAGENVLRDKIKEVLSQGGFDPAMSFDDTYAKLIRPALQNMLQDLLKPKAEPAAPATEEPPEAPATEVPPEAVPEAPATEVPATEEPPVPPEVVPPAPEAEPDGPIPMPPEAKPAAMGSLRDKLPKNRKAVEPAPAVNPEDELANYVKELSSIIDNYGPLDKATKNKLLMQWVKLKAQMLGGDEGKALDELESSGKEKEFAQNLAIDPEAAITSMRDELINMKKQLLGMSQVGESFKQKVEKYKRLIRESAAKPTVSQGLRQKLMLS